MEVVISKKSFFFILFLSFILSSCGDQSEKMTSQDMGTSAATTGSQALPGTSWSYLSGYSPSFGSLSATGIITFEQNNTQWADLIFANQKRAIFMSKFSFGGNDTMLIHSDDEQDESIKYSIKGNELTTIDSDKATMVFKKMSDKQPMPILTKYDIEKNSLWILVSKEANDSKLTPSSNSYGTLGLEKYFDTTKNRTIKRVNVRYGPDKKNISQISCDSSDYSSPIPEVFKFENLVEDPVTHEITGMLTLRLLSDTNNTICSIDLNTLELMNITNGVKNADVVFDLKISNYELTLTNRSNDQKYLFKVSEFEK